MSDALVAPPPSLLRKLEEIDRRYIELESQLSDPAVLSNSQRIVSVSKEKGQLEGIVSRYREYRQAAGQIEELRELIENKSDRDMADLAASELPDAQRTASDIMGGVKRMNSWRRRTMQSMRSSWKSGPAPAGKKPALFARDLYEMYRRYAGTHRWKFVVNDFSVSERGGFKECIISMYGYPGAYRHFLRFEGAACDTACSACRKPKRRGGSIHRPPPSR